MNANKILLLIAVAVLAMVGRAWYKRPSSVQGDKAIDFPLSETRKLSDLKGKYVLLDFWGSWCGPCLEEAPKLVEFSKKMGNHTFTDAQGFCMVGFGIEDNSAAHIKAINQLQMITDVNTCEWIHTTDLKKFDSPLAKQYGVRVIPTKFLINPEGMIIAVNPSFDQLDKILLPKLVK